MTMSTYRAIIAAALCLAAANANAATPDPSKPLPGGENGPKPAAWGPGVSEWNAPKHIYVVGDPILMTKDNAHTGKRITFVACPYVRDSALTPLWFADYEGETYFLRAQQNFTAAVHHPDLMHKVLVEGVVSNEARVAGGVVLTPLRISVLPEIDETCNKVLPADGSRIPFAKRPPGPGSDGTTREQSGAGPTHGPAPITALEPEYKPEPVAERIVKTFTMEFDFDHDRVDFDQYPAIMAAMKYARDTSAARIEVVGYRSAVKLSNKKTIVEYAGLERRRTENVVRLMDQFPVSKEIVAVRWETKPTSTNGVTDFANRRVTITVTPGPAPDGAATKAASAKAVNEARLSR